MNAGGVSALLPLGLLLASCQAAGPSATATAAVVPSVTTPTPFVAVPVAPQDFVQTCLLERSVCNPNDYTEPAPFPADLLRPLSLSRLSPSQQCPVSPSQQVDTGSFGGSALGTGPVRPLLGGTLQSVDGWRGIKTLWYSDPSYQGAVRIRGARIDGDGAVAFGERPEVSELIIPPEPTINGHNGYREAPGGTWFMTPGCYAWQVDGEGFSTVIVFLAP